MILEALLKAFDAVISTLLGLFPAGTDLPEELWDVVSTVTPAFATAGYFFPLDTLFRILVLMIASEIIFATVWFTMLFWKLVRG